MIKTWIKKIWTNTQTHTSSDISDTESIVTEDMEIYLINQNTIDQIIKDTSFEVLPMLIDNFLREAELRTANIVTAIENTDFTKLEFETHTLGSTALAMGATGLGLMARKMETACLNGTPQIALEQKAALQTLTKQSKQAFSNLLLRIQHN